MAAPLGGSEAFRVDDVPTGGKPKYYVLEMFPYPSGSIHVGHVRNYTLGDVVARYKRACGFDVLHPMGWDAFGLPAENAARERGVHPADWTWANIAAMRAELQRMGLSIDWSREFATCDPAYYGQQQKLFLRSCAGAGRPPAELGELGSGRRHRAGQRAGGGRSRLALRRARREAATGAVVLPHHDVGAGPAGGVGRAGPLARPGARDAGEMDRPQRGRAGPVRAGATIGGLDAIEVYTTRPDTLFGMSFLAVAPEHPVAAATAAVDPAAAAFIAECRALGTSEAAIETAEKRGFDTGLTVRHPFTGRTIPVWIANFVLMEYGTGAIFGCPCGDQRDLDFARKYDLAGLPVVLPPGEDAARSRSARRRMTGRGRSSTRRSWTG